MNKKIYLAVVLAVFSFTLFSCGNDDEPSDNGKAVSLNVMNEDNGMTTFQGIYMNRSDNFVSDNAVIYDMGSNKRIGSIGIPNFVNPAAEVAVQPGHGYVIYDGSLEKFYSGTKAMPCNATLCRVFVDSWIKNEKNANQNKGAVIHYENVVPGSNGLPEWGTEVNIPKNGLGYYYNNPVIVNLPSTDCELKVQLGSEKIVSAQISGRKLILIPLYEVTTSCLLRIRRGNVYTQIKVNIDMQ
jgi:hypothetical protein